MNHIKLDVGCGPNCKEGFDGVDIRQCKDVKYLCNSWEIDKHVKNSSVSEIFTRHFLEHLNFKQFKETMSSWQKVLIFNGKIEIIVPDMDYHINQFLNLDWDDTAEFSSKCSVINHALAGFWGWQRGGFDETWDIHKSGYNFKLLKMKLEEHGFCNVVRLKDKPWNLHIKAVSNKSVYKLTNAPVFIHVPKTGGCSVIESRAILSCYGHKSIKRLKRLKTPEEFENRIKFTIVRNPYSRIKSVYYFLKNSKPGSQFHKKIMNTWFSKVEKYENLNEFCEDLPSLLYPKPQIVHLTPQCEYVCDDDKNIIVDYVFKLENIQKEWVEMCDIFKWGNIPLPHLNVSNKGTDTYSPKSKKIISDLYSDDFEIFKYEK